MKYKCSLPYGNGGRMINDPAGLEKQCLYRDYDMLRMSVTCSYGPTCIFTNMPTSRTGREIMADFVKNLSNDEKTILKSYLKEKSGG